MSGLWGEGFSVGFSTARETFEPRLIAAEQKIAAVIAIHHPSADHAAGMDPYCVGCWRAGGEDGAPSWPCPTIAALDLEHTP
jgi:hypothetical protein